MSQSLRKNSKPKPSVPLNGKDLNRALLILLFFFLAYYPKIYLINQIYYESRNLVRINSYLTLLEEENQQIKQQLEAFRFQELINSESH